MTFYEKLKAIIRNGVLGQREHNGCRTSKQPSSGPYQEFGGSGEKGHLLLGSWEQWQIFQRGWEANTFGSLGSRVFFFFNKKLKSVFSTKFDRPRLVWSFGTCICTLYVCYHEISNELKKY